MKALITVVIAVLLSAGSAVLLLLRGPAWAWWVNPAALMVLAVTVPLAVAVALPREWWRG